MPARFSGSAVPTMMNRAVGRRAPHFPQSLDRARHRELLARHAGHEVAAADFPARLEPPVDAREIAPRRGDVLARQQAAEDDAVAAEQCPRRGLDRGAADVSSDGREWRWRSSARRKSPADRAPPAAGRVHQ